MYLYLLRLLLLLLCLCAIFAQLLYTETDDAADVVAHARTLLTNLHRHCLLTLRAFLLLVHPCLATRVCVCVSLPVSSLAVSCLFLMCIFTDADFYFFAGCDISFGSNSSYSSATELNVTA